MSKGGRRIHFLDESWVFKKMSCSLVWEDIARKATDGCFTVTNGKGERFILSHMGCADTSLLDQCILLFSSSKSNKSAGYHTEMN